MSNNDQMIIPGSRLRQQHELIKEQLNQAIARVIQKGVFTPSIEVENFEREFAEYVGVKYAIGVGSGSAALMLALRALEIGNGGEVILAPNADISVSAPLSHAGGHLVWVDINPRTYNLDPQALEVKITAKTKAIVVVHMYGNPAAMSTIQQIAAKHRVAVIEDAALATGATYQGKRVGGIADLGCFSFSPGKMLGALGKAGMIVTNNTTLAERIRGLASYGFSLTSLKAIEKGIIGTQFEYLQEGYNARLDELQAAVLRVKLQYLDTWLQRRRENANLYRDLLADLEPEHLLLPQDTSGSEPAFRAFVIRSPRRDNLMVYLAEAGIWTGLTYVPPLHLQPIYQYLGDDPGSFPQTELVANELLCLPTYPELTRSEVEKVSQKIRQFFLS